MEFVRLFAKLIFFIMVIIVWAIYMGEGEDTSNIIATGVIGAAVMGTYQNTKITFPGILRSLSIGHSWFNYFVNVQYLILKLEGP